MVYSIDMITHDQILAELIRQTENEKSITKSAIAKELNIPASRVTEITKGLRKIQQSEMPILSEMLGMINQAPVNIENSTYIPIIGKVATGLWLEESYANDLAEDRIEYDAGPDFHGAHNLFAVIPEGDSMNLIFPDNCTLICQRNISGDWGDFIGKYD